MNPSKWYLYKATEEDFQETGKWVLVEPWDVADDLAEPNIHTFSSHAVAIAALDKALFSQRLRSISLNPTRAERQDWNAYP